MGRDSPPQRPQITYTVVENQRPRVFQQHHAPAEGEGEGVCAGEEGAQEGVHGEQGACLLRRPPRPRSPLPLHRRLRLPQLQTQSVRERGRSMSKTHRERMKVLRSCLSRTAYGPASNETLLLGIRNLKLC